MRVAIILTLFRFIYLPAFTVAYVFTFVRQSQPISKGERISKEITGPNPKACTRIDYTRWESDFPDSPNRIVALKVWTTPLFGRAPWAFAFYQLANNCGRDGNKPSLVAYFFPRNDVNSLQVADWGPLAVQTGILPKFTSWQELKPDTPDWQKYIVDTGLQPGEILMDIGFGKAQGLERIRPFLADVKFWDLSRAYYRFNANMDVIRDDELMRDILSGQDSANTYFPDLLNSRAPIALEMVGHGRTIPGLRFESIQGGDWAEGIMREQPEVKELKEEVKIKYDEEEAIADIGANPDLSVQEILKEEYEDAYPVEDFYDEYAYEDPTAGYLKEESEYYYDGNDPNAIEMGNLDPYDHGYTWEDYPYENPIFKTESEPDEKSRMSLKVEYDDTQHQSLFEEEESAFPGFSQPQYQPEGYNKIEEESQFVQNMRNRAGFPLNFIQQMELLKHEMPLVPTFIRDELQQSFGLDPADSGSFDDIIWHLRRQYAISDLILEPQRREAERLQAAQFEAEQEFQRARNLATDQIQRAYEAVMESQETHDKIEELE
ncbi:hypothetical protein TWF696_004917 [Orbilia brochopaga]|uniref:Uncharacterized protein n=1 Tax=Orbilia brochopaga TaxID=3140254 RepID=A0AAV9V026_9PEZI